MLEFKEAKELNWLNSKEAKTLTILTPKAHNLVSVKMYDFSCKLTI